jgi:hypothetical protein
MNDIILMAALNMVASILLLLLIAIYITKLWKFIPIFVIFLIGVFLNNYYYKFFEILLFILIIIPERETLKFNFNAIVYTEVEETRDMKLKKNASRNELYFFLAFIITPFSTYPVLFYTSYKFYQLLEKPIKKNQYYRFAAFNIIIAIAPFLAYFFGLSNMSLIWTVYFVLASSLYPKVIYAIYFIHLT